MFAESYGLTREFFSPSVTHFECYLQACHLSCAASATPSGPPPPPRPVGAAIITSKVGCTDLMSSTAYGGPCGREGFCVCLHLPLSPKVRLRVSSRSCPPRCQQCSYQEGHVRCPWGRQVSMLEKGSIRLPVAPDLSGCKESVSYEESALPCAC